MESGSDNGISQVKQARPVAVTILGWVFAAFSALILFGSLFGLAAFAIMRRLAPKGQLLPSPRDAVPQTAPIYWAVRHFTPLACLQVALALFSIFAVVSFLRLRPWSRNFFEVLTWLNILWSFAFGAYWVYMWRGIAATIPTAGQAPPSPPPAAIANFGTVMGIGMALFNAAIPAIVLFLLRSHFVRPAFQSQARTREVTTS